MNSFLQKLQDWFGRGESPSFPALDAWEIPESVHRDTFRRDYVFTILMADRDAHLMPPKVLIEEADRMFDALKGDGNE